MGMDGMALAGKVVVVTGASSGIGKATATVVGGLGCNVVLVGRDSERLRATASDIERIGGRALASCGDLDDEAFIERTVEATVEAFGPVHGLVHNASVIEIETLDAVTTAALLAQWRINVLAPLLLTRAALPHMSEGGSIVVISSTAARAGLGGIAGYTATKGAVASMALSMADELAPRGIRVNVVSPGWVRTPMVAPQFEAAPEFEALIKSRSLVGRIGEPEDIARAVAFLLSPVSAYVDGANLVVDGGGSASMNLR